MLLHLKLNNWEVDNVADLMNILDNIHINSSLEDRKVWTGDPKGTFSVSSLFNRMNGKVNYPCLASFLWKSKVPSKVDFFMWILFQGNPPLKICSNLEAS